MLRRYSFYLAVLIGGGLFVPLFSSCAELADAPREAAGAGKKAPGKQTAVVDMKHLTPEQNARLRAIVALTERLEPLQQKMPPVRPGEWRSFWKENPQPPQLYAASMPVTITRERPALYLYRVGTFTNADEQLFLLIQDYLARCFSCPVKIAPDIPLSAFPPSARTQGDKREVRLNSVHLTDKLLKPALPADGWAAFAVSANDIYQSTGLSEQYGDSLLFGRAGVISLYHLKTSDARNTLLRSLKGASHEAAHMLSLPHCSLELCNMNGRSGLAEFDRAPLWFCPDCLAKLLYATGGNAARRAGTLAEFCRENGLASEAEYFTRAAGLLAASGR